MIALLALNANAKKWRVNNTVGIQADFQTPQLAHNSSLVLAGDTLYIEGSQTSYGALTLSKPLAIFGPGYFLDKNPNTQYSKLPAILSGVIYFNDGSDGTIVTGMTTSNLYIQGASNISIRNNYINGNLYFYVHTTSYNISNISIKGNYINGSILTLSNFGTLQNVQNIAIFNNYIYKDNTGYSIYLKTSGSYCSGIIMNNVIEGGNFETSNFSYLNNIIVSGTLPTDTTTNAYMYNLSNGVQLPVGNGNIRNVNMAIVFIDPIGNSTDGKWQLKSGSPAISAASDGGNCGMFGGVDPYKLSGVSGPSIYSIIMPNAGTPANGINVTVKVKAN